MKLSLLSLTHKHAHWSHHGNNHRTQTDLLSNMKTAPTTTCG